MIESVQQLSTRQASARAVLYGDKLAIGVAVGTCGLANGAGEVLQAIRDEVDRLHLDFVVHGRRGLGQPAMKCRGREYLRIIYGPAYDAPEHLDRLRSRGLSTKRSLALREFALGVEALERFVRREPLRRAHECVFGVLAMESEPVDPRL